VFAEESGPAHLIAVIRKRTRRDGDVVEFRHSWSGRRKRRKLASVALADPHRDVGGFQGLVHDTGQVILGGTNVRVCLVMTLVPGMRCWPRW
jgi:hypothetical protein